MVSLCTNGQPNIYTCKGVLIALNELTVVTDRPTNERKKQSVEVAIRLKIIFIYIFHSKKNVFRKLIMYTPTFLETIKHCFITLSHCQGSLK